MTAGVSNKRPDFIIIGAMKCATSTMRDQLSIYNGFFMTTPKEPCFFSDDDIYSKGISWYESLFDGAKNGQIKGEASTHYSKLPNYPKTIERLKTLCPDVKIIYIMRHPIERLVSHYMHEWTQKVITCDIDRAVYDFPELIEYGCYYMQLEPYLKTFGKSSILPLFAERLRQDPIRELESVFHFLKWNGIPVWNNELRSNVSTERVKKSTSRDILVDNKLARALRRKLVPKSVRNRIKKLWQLNEKPKLSDKTYAYVEKKFDQDLKQLGEITGTELNCKTFKLAVGQTKKIEWIE